MQQIPQIITPKYLSVICRQETGKAPSVWIRERLIEKIRYKQQFGCTPMEYRNKQMNSES